MNKKQNSYHEKDSQAEYGVVIIGGFAGSGSSAVVDLLCEFDGFKHLDIEFRMITDPDGIMSLENNLVTDWSPYRSDIAIKRFKKLIHALGNKRKSPYYGQDYNKMLCPDFTELSEKYIHDLISFKYTGKWFGIETAPMYYARKMNFHLNKLLSLIKFKYYRSFYKDIYVAYPDDNFLPLTKSYLNSLISSAFRDSEVLNIIIDEGFSSMNPVRVMNYFHSSKSIIIHRDPRDIFVNARKYNFDFIPEKIDDFILWQKYMQQQTEKFDNPNLLRINFEDLILKYEETSAEIKDFLNLTDSAHINPQKYLKPEISAKNIGLWKNYHNQKEIDKIYTELKKYCVDN